MGRGGPPGNIINIKFIAHSTDIAFRLTLVVLDSLDLCLLVVELERQSLSRARPRSLASELLVSVMKSDKGGVDGLSRPEIFPQLTDLPSVGLLLFLSVFKAPVSFLNMFRDLRDIIHHFI